MLMYACLCMHAEVPQCNVAWRVLSWRIKVVAFTLVKFSFISFKVKLINIYEVACPVCGKTYICMTQRCLSVQLKEHATRISSSAVGQHLSECEQAQYLASLQNQFTQLNDLPLPSDSLSPIQILVLNNYKIIHSTKSNYILAFLEPLLIKHNKPFFNTGLKASKELRFFT